MYIHLILIKRLKYASNIPITRSPNRKKTNSCRKHFSTPLETKRLHHRKQLRDDPPRVSPRQIKTHPKLYIYIINSAEKGGNR